MSQKATPDSVLRATATMPVFNIVETYSATIDNIPNYSSVLAQSLIQQRGRI